MNTIKIVFGILFLTLCGVSCRSQNKNTLLQNDANMNNPIVTKKFEKFNFEQYENRENKNSLVLEKVTDGIYIRLMKIKAGLFYKETKPNEYFSISKTYFENGNIKAKGLCFNVNCIAFKKGIWYEFDESGSLIKTIDYDKPFRFTFEDILRFCEKEGIEVKKGPILQSTGYHTEIERIFSALSKTSQWVIRRLKEPDLIEEITLDGNTGKVLKRTETEYINN